jgi:uncharacterized membrane protein
VVASALAGLIWTIQLVVYPAFALVGDAEWARYGQQHRRRITWLAAPLMTANVSVALVLIVEHATALSVVNAALASSIFAVTGLVFAPMHGRLEHTATARAVRRLVRANWVRTLGWTVQVAVAIALI